MPTDSPGNSAKPPALVFSHFGYHVPDVEAAADFYANVLGFAVSDLGSLSGSLFGMSGKLTLIFMTRRPFEHHQLIPVSGRDPALPTTVNQIGFLAPDLTELKRIRELLIADGRARDLAAIDHGIQWSLYFTEPGGAPVSISVESPWFVPQPQHWPLDLAAPVAVIEEVTARRCREIAGFKPRTAWRAETEAVLAATGRLVPQATPAIEAVDSKRWRDSVFHNDLARRAIPGAFPKIAMQRVGLRAIDVERLARFYEQTLGYLRTGHGRMPAVGAQPAADYVFLTRDPQQFAQLMLVSGRDESVPSSVNQLTFRVPSMEALRDIHVRMQAHPAVTGIAPTHHGNSFSIYCNDPEGNRLELSYESDWYIPAPTAWRLDFSQSDQEMFAEVERKCQQTPRFMMRNEWKARARAELMASGRLEAEELYR